MNNGTKSLSINETFIIEPVDGVEVYSACTAFYTNNILSCTGNTEIIMGIGGVSTNLSFSANTFYGDGSNLTGISTQDTFVTGGTYSAGTAIFRNNTGGTFSVSGFSTGANFTGGTVSGATRFTNGLTANTISATTYYNVSTNFQYEIHVSTADGNDTTGNGDLLNPVATITKALTLLTGSRKTIIVHPGGYNENVTVANGNTTIATSELTGANTLLYGTLTIGTLGSGSRISGLKMTNLVISETAQAYISNCTVDTQVTKSSSGYVEILDSELQCISGVQISGAGITIINGNKNVAVSVSNASAQVIIKGCNSVVTPSASAGNLAIVDCIVTALGGNAITITNSATTLTLVNSQVLVQAGNNVAPISVAGIYSIFNTIYDKPNSTLNGTSTNSIDYFQYINADKFITQGGTSLQYVMGDGSLSSGFTGGTVSGATRFTNGLTANTISATTYENLPIKYYAEFSGSPSIRPIVYSANSIAIGDGAEALNENMFVVGQYAGREATDASNSNFIGYEAGFDSTEAESSNFFGNSAGREATDASNSNFFGYQAGYNATTVSDSNFFGYVAGNGATDASNSNFFGENAGFYATNANDSNFLGRETGSGATNANFSNFFGYRAGSQVTGASYSTLIGFNVGSATGANLSIGLNNIIIGTNISLPTGTQDSINIGGVLFGSNTYFNSNSTNPFTGALSTGRIGINVVQPTHSLHVSGDTRIQGGLTATTYNGYNPLPTQAAISSGVTLSFITDTVYGTLLTPETSSAITANVTGALLGVTNILIHSGSTTPTFESQYKKLSGSGNYSAGTINYIFCTYIASTEIIYSINQR